MLAHRLIDPFVLQTLGPVPNLDCNMPNGTAPSP